MVEHAYNAQAFVRDAARQLRRGGLLLASTINRTPRSFLTAIVGNGYTVRALPRRTHRWAQFVRLDESNQAALASGLTEHDCRSIGW